MTAESKVQNVPIFTFSRSRVRNECRTNQMTHLWRVTADPVGNRDIVVLQVVAVGQDFPEVPRGRHGPHVAAAVFGKHIRIRPGKLSFLYDRRTW